LTHAARIAETTAMSAPINASPATANATLTDFGCLSRARRQRDEILGDRGHADGI